MWWSLWKPGGRSSHLWPQVEFLGLPGCPGSEPQPVPRRKAGTFPFSGTISLSVGLMDEVRVQPLEHQSAHRWCFFVPAIEKRDSAIVLLAVFSVKRE